MRLAWPLAGLLAAIPAAGQAEPGAAGAQFLSLAAGARSIAMGEAQTAATLDAYSGHSNPAALSLLRHPEAAFTFNSFYQGIDEQNLAYAQPLGAESAASIHLTRLSAGEMEGFDADGFSRESMDAGSLSASLSYGRLIELPYVLPPLVRVGATARWIHESLARYKASAFAGGAGLLLTDWENALGELGRGLKLGFAARNLGAGLKFHQENSPLPRVYSVGLALERRPWGDPLTAAVDYHVGGYNRDYMGLGLEYWARGILALRVGYRANSDEGLGIRGGLGFRLKRLVVDYAFAESGRLGHTHRFGIHFRFGGPADLAEKTAADFISAGSGYLKQKRYFEAAAEFNRALDLDPGSRQALDLLRQALREADKQPEAKKERDATR